MLSSRLLGVAKSAIFGVGWQLQRRARFFGASVTDDAVDVISDFAVQGLAGVAVAVNFFARVGGIADAFGRESGSGGGLNGRV